MRHTDPGLSGDTAVIAPDGQKVGKLEDLLYDKESGGTSLLLVKTGRLSGRRRVVPLMGASFSRDYVRVDDLPNHLPRSTKRPIQPDDPGAEAEKSPERHPIGERKARPPRRGKQGHRQAADG